MNNKTSDKNVANVEEDVKVLKDLMKELKLEKQTALHNNEYGEYITECDVLDLYDMQILALQHILAEREQMLKAINTVEKEKSDWIKAYQEEKDSQFDLLKRIKELEEEVKMLDEAYTGTIKESKKWFDIAHNSIPTQVVIEALENIEDYFERLNGPDEDIDYIRQVKKELLEGEK